MRYTIGARECDLAHVFCDEYSFKIPDYQRPYAWGEDQAAELVQDIRDAMANPDGDPGDPPPYFLGTIVLIKPSREMAVEVVDGQQRLTTLTILYSALRELVVGEQRQNSIDTRILAPGDVFAGVQPSPRLKLRAQDFEFFRDNVQTRGNFANFVQNYPNQESLSDSQKRILENASYIYKTLRKMSDSDIHRFAEFLTKSCYLVIVSTSDKEAAYRIFSVMNNRGLDLSPVDILKASIIGEISEGEENRTRKDYTKLWEHVEDRLGRDGFEHLFRHIRMIYKKEKQRHALESGNP